MFIFWLSGFSSSSAGGRVIIITSAMLGIIGASLHNVVMMQHCQCVANVHLLKQASDCCNDKGSHCFGLLLDKVGLEGSQIEKASLSAVQWKYSRHAVFNSGLQVIVA